VRIERWALLFVASLASCHLLTPPELRGVERRSVRDATPIEPRAPLEDDSTPAGGRAAKGALEIPDAPPGASAQDASVGADSARRSNDGDVARTVGEPHAAVTVPWGEYDCSHDPEVLVLLERYYDGFAAGDWSRVAENFWPNATIVTIRSPDMGAPPTVVSMRIEDYVARHADSGVRPSPLKLTLDLPRTETNGSVSSVFVRYRAVDPSGADEQSWRGVDLFSLVRHEGEWRIASLVFEGARFGR